ncbi:hypothetical protein L9F63_025271, partial [Diploptera punctata]
SEKKKLMNFEIPDGRPHANILVSTQITSNHCRRFRNIGKKLPRILSDKTTSLNSLVDSIKFLFSTYTENMIEVFKSDILDKVARFQTTSFRVKKHRCM